MDLLLEDAAAVEAGRGAGVPEYMAGLDVFGVPRPPARGDRVVDARVHSEVLRLTGARAAAARRTGTPGPEGPIGKLAAAELDQRVRELHLDLLGPAGMLYTTFEMTRPERSVSDSPHRSFLVPRS